ncbi:PGA biosynthesis protein CapA-like [Tubulanus polymorphus]|uniref:PGA biosynthesis protein CapA-like n=1 Tax=Tubulanus polymorphus TaxID=672921 RepID=UPI003DA3B46C
MERESLSSVSLDWTFPYQEWFVVTTVFVLTCCYFVHRVRFPTNVSDDTRTPPKTISLLFAGDIMAHRDITRTAYDEETQTYDYNPIFRFIKSRLSGVDFAIGNLECSVGSSPDADWANGHFTIVVPPAFVEALRNAGFDVLVTANNHANDIGKAGIVKTSETLDEFGIRHTGAFVDGDARRRLSPLILEKDGFRIALLAFTRHTPSERDMEPPTEMNYLEETTIRREVERAKNMNVDQIIAFVHWGKEFQEHPDYYRQKLWFKFFKELGVNIVIGSHPHVLQPMVWDKKDDSLVVYSLGNFLADMKYFKILALRGSAILNLVLEKRADGKVSIKTAYYELMFIQKREIDYVAQSFAILPIAEFERNFEYFSDIANKNESMTRSATDMRRLMAVETVGIRERGAENIDPQKLELDSKYMRMESKAPPVRICPSLESMKRDF